MSYLFISLYRFFKERKIVFYGSLLVLLLVSFLGASQLTLEEDITKVMPHDKKIEQLNEVLKNASFTEKLVFTVSLQDSVANPDSLIAFTKGFSNTLSQEEFSPYIKQLSDEVASDKISKGFDFFYEHLPLFLSQNDYKELDSYLDEKTFEKKMNQVYKTLISPASIFLKKSILRDPLSLTPMAFKKVQALQFDDNFTLYDDYIITKDHKNTFLFLYPSDLAKESKETTKFIQLLNQRIQEFEAKNNQKLKVQYFGGLAVANANVVQIKDDIILTVSIAVIGLLLLLGFFFRSKSIFFLLFLPVVLAGGLALAFVYLFKTTVSAISLGVGSVILGVTIDFSLHIITHYKSTRSFTKLLENISLPLLISSLTTSSAFFCLLFLKSEALNDLGLFAGMSVLFASILSLIVLPQVIRFKNKGAEKTHTDRGFLNKLAAYPVHQNKWIVGIVVLMLLTSIYFSPQVQFEQDMMRINYMTEDLKKAENHLNQIADISRKSIYVISSGKTIEQALQANEKNQIAIEQLKQDSVITAYTSIGDLYFSVQKQQQKIKDWETFWTIERQAKFQTLLNSNSKRLRFKTNTFKAFQNLLSKQHTVCSQEDFAMLRNLFLEDYIIEKENEVSIITLLKLDRARQKQVYATLDNATNTLIFDKQTITTKLVSMIREEFDTLVKMCFGLVFLILLVSYGRIELALVTFTPIILSWLCTLGLMSIFGLTFNIINIIISTFIFGLGIDYSIFIMQGLQQKYQYGEEDLTSYKTSILLSAATTILGIGVLIFAEHPSLKSIALLSIVGLISVILITFTIEPLLFRLLVYTNGEKRRQPLTLLSGVLTLLAYTYFVLGAFFLTIVGFFLFYLVPVSKQKKEYFYHIMIQKFAKVLLFIFVNLKKDIQNPLEETFEKPAIIVANHQSFIDILLMIILSPKVIIMTKDWVWESKIFGRIVRWAGYLPASYGNEKGLAHIQQKVTEGYSVVIFPEGTRSENNKIKRFHKGAFFLAEQLELDVLPIVLHGTGDCIKKGEFIINKGTLTVKILPRINYDDSTYGEGYSMRTKKISKAFKEHYAALRVEKETVDYVYSLIEQNYIYKGPILEWYFKVKVGLEKRYQFFHEALPTKGRIVDIGCGYGFLGYFLNRLSEDREVLGLDYDVTKITLAQHNAIKNDRINFMSGDAILVDFGPADAFVMCDILHYLPIQKQNLLIEKCIQNLNEGGVLIIREGDKELDEQKHKGTKLTELFSTQLLGFNKTEHKLEFFSRKQLITIASQYNLKVEIVDETKFTSNVIFMVRK